MRCGCGCTQLRRHALDARVNRVLRPLSALSGRDGRETRSRTLSIQRVLAATLLGAAIVVLGGALLPGASAALAFVSLALALAAATSWRVGSRIAREFQESNAWAEVAQLRALLAERETVWSDLPAPAAAWDAAGQLVIASVA